MTANVAERGIAGVGNWRRHSLSTRAVTQADGTLKAYVLTYFTGQAPTQ